MIKDDRLFEFLCDRPEAKDCYAFDLKALKSTNLQGQSVRRYELLLCRLQKWNEQIAHGMPETSQSELSTLHTVYATLLYLHLMPSSYKQSVLKSLVQHLAVRGSNEPILPSIRQEHQSAHYEDMTKLIKDKKPFITAEIAKLSKTLQSHSACILHNNNDHDMYEIKNSTSRKARLYGFSSIHDRICNTHSTESKGIMKSWMLKRKCAINKRDLCYTKRVSRRDWKILADESFCNAFKIKASKRPAKMRIPMIDVQNI